MNSSKICLFRLFRRKIRLITLLLLTGWLSFAFGKSANPIPDSTIAMKQWVDQHFAKGKIPPFSFIYNGKKSDEFIGGWQFRVEKPTTSDPNSEETIFTYSDPVSGLAVKCAVTCFTDFPAVEWVLKFVNTS